MKALLYLFAPCIALPTGTVHAQQTPPSELSWQVGDLSLNASMDVNAYYYAMRGTWWGLAPSNYNTNRSWAELWVHPRVNATYAIDAERQFFGGVSLGITKDIGGNPYDYHNQGDTHAENAFIGYRAGSQQGWHYEISGGRQPFTLGTGMLLTAGSSNGTEWGGSASCKRIAWQNTAIAKIGYGNTAAQAFWINPAETPSAETHTRITGASVEWADKNKGKAGLAYLHVPKSDAIYPGSLAPFAFIEKGREGMNAYHGWSELKGFFGQLPALSLRGEFAIENGRVTRLSGLHDKMKAYAWYLGGSYWFQQWPFAPKISYGYGYFSGDKHDTAKYERFDPMFWGNGLDNWWFGANGSYSYLNSNIKYHRLTIDAYVSAKDILKFQYVRADAAQLNSPIQFGQGVRFASGSYSPVVGVDSKHLSDEFMLQYVHLFSPKIALSTYVSQSLPGKGLRALATPTSQNWTAFGMGISASF